MPVPPVFSVSEANTTNIYLGNMGATDPDLVGMTNGVSYNLSGADSLSFAIDTYSGDLTFTGRASYRAQTDYSIVVSAHTTAYAPESISELVVLHVDQVYGNVVGNDVWTNFNGMQGTYRPDLFTVYYSTGTEAWTGLTANNNRIFIYKYDPALDHIYLLTAWPRYLTSPAGPVA